MLLNEAHKPVMTWEIQQAWPVKVEGPSLNAKGNEVAIETVEFAHEGMLVKNG
jgi:phage tail-like protein